MALSGAGTDLETGESALSRAARQAAYVEGLARGMDLAERGSEGFLLKAMAEAVILLQKAQEEIYAELGGESGWRAPHAAGDGADDEEAEVELTCHRCGSLLSFDAALLDEEDLELTCPTCGEVVYEPGDELVDEADQEERPERGASRVQR